ncbi:hypothetical protein WN51_06296 [Melipona quadrifasciata]|uniref:Uncharacterized protein n=1 Tax=Melipona quadrifasciata TaxID=166423 RepID=A0A0M8ZSJ8_9HYME|nr:hypothetical protein WN51_06296 [Melipona quadrifasciata]
MINSVDKSKITRIPTAECICFTVFLQRNGHVPELIFRGLHFPKIFDMYLTFSIGDSAISFRMDKLSSTICDRGSPTLVCSKKATEKLFEIKLEIRMGIAQQVMFYIDQSVPKMRRFFSHKMFDKFHDDGIKSDELKVVVPQERDRVAHNTSWYVELNDDSWEHMLNTQIVFLKRNQY